MTTGYAIYDDEWGVYLGGFMGLGFWSKLSRNHGQGYAPLFKTRTDAVEHIRTWQQGTDRPYTFVEVEVDHEAMGCGYASVVSCVKAGIPAWDTTDPDPEEFQRMHAPSVVPFRNYLLQTLNVCANAWNLPRVVVFCCVSQLLGQMGCLMAENAATNEKDPEYDHAARIKEMLLKNFEQGQADFNEYNKAHEAEQALMKAQPEGSA